ncbi:hypothetical protein [Streptomyces sp. NPDC088910]|uniref:hypothetical protein n=1 Tax=Streptomyces sp. NPDC088910 TaxID=3365911 RepID=UPI00381F710C
MADPQWKRLIEHVMAVPERVYEHWSGADGWDNDTEFGKEYGENRVSWCVIFDWDMYHDVGLDQAVPKTDNVTAFSTWARSKGAWSAYPSIGAWVNLDGGGHTEIVTGFDERYVHTKGGNSVKAGATDRGQGNGVWSHRELRHAQRVTGYFAPRFPDGICPPTADPADPRGGTAVASYRVRPTATTHPAPAFPGREYFVLGAVSDHTLLLQTWLQRGNWGPPYKVGPSRTMTALDLTKVKALQRHYVAALGPADGAVGPLTWLYAYEVAYGLRAR